MCRKWSASATCCIFEPGSVMAMKWLPAFSAPTVCFTRSKKYCLKMLGSSVVPDLLETMNNVFARLILFSNALTCAGIGGIEHVQLREARDPAEGLRAALRGKDWNRPCPAAGCR